jgi:hypothetical protein
VAAEPAAQAFRVPAGRAVAIGRDGKEIYRQTSMGGGNDPFAIDPFLVPEGWVYEWKRYSIYGQVDYTHLSKLARVGRWTPVPAERHPGVFLPPDAKGPIIHDGLQLMERPLALHEEAMEEEKRAADGAMRRAKAERGLAAASPGIDTATPAARNATFVRTERINAEDRAAMESLPRPTYEPADRNSID